MSGINTELKNPWAIQRMDMVSKDCNVKFSDRFKNDLMGATEYERGYQAACIRIFAEGDCEVGIIKVGGLDMVAAWRPSVSTREQIQDWVQRIYFEQWGHYSPHDYTAFTSSKRDLYLADVKQWERDPFREGRRTFHQFTNAWFDIENCVFWTWEKINPKDLLKNFRKSLEYMNAKRESSTVNDVRQQSLTQLCDDRR